MAALGPLLAALVRLLGDLGASGSDLGSLLGDLEAILERLGANLGRLRAILGRLGGILGRSGAPKSSEVTKGAAVHRAERGPPRDFLRKFLRDLREYKGSSKRSSSEWIHNTPCCAGGGGLKSASRDHRRHPLCSTVLKVLSVFVRTNAGNHCG